MWIFTPLLILLAAALPSFGQNPALAITDSIPGTNWEQVRPEAAGFSTLKLESLRSWLKAQDTESMMIVFHGRAIFSYGDVTHASKIASVRKSIVGMLYGNYVFSSTINLNKTVEQLGLEEKTPFLPIETHATLEQLLAGRSGIYTAPDDLLPKRGTHYPGTYFQYQNWDFNAAGAAFEKLTGKGVYEAFAKELAAPLGMQDFSLTQQHKLPEEGSVHPQHAMYLSTRDMARLGLLMLDLGQWDGKSIIPADWVRYETTLITPFDQIHPSEFQNAGEPERWGFGATWWVWDAPAFPGGIYSGFLQGAYSAMGTGGTFITVLPARGLVVVHKVDIDRNEHASVSPSSYMAILSMIENSRCGDACTQ